MAGKGGALHEDFTRSAPIAGSSNRSFGLVFAGFFTIVAALSWWNGGHRWPWYLIAAAVFSAAALLVPSILTPLNRVWTALGLMLHKVAHPIVMAIIFFGVVTPLGLLMRTLGKRPLNLEFRATTPSYWIKRTNNERRADAMKRQF